MAGGRMMLGYVIPVTVTITGILGLFLRKRMPKTLLSIALVVVGVLMIYVEYSSKQRLIFDSCDIEEIDSGYKVTVTLKPSKNEPMGVVTLIARLPENTSTKILTISPKVKGLITGYSSPDVPQISQDGKFAITFFQPGTMGLFSLDIEVSGKTKIFIEGTHELKSFSIEI